MNHVMMLSAALACSCAGAFGGTDEPNEDRADGGVRPRAATMAPDGGPPQDEPPDVRLRVRRAWWDSTTALSVVITLDNFSSMPVAMGPFSFELEVDDATSAARPSSAPEACAAGAVVLPAERGRCTLRFEVLGEPGRVRHRPTGRAAPIDPCSPTRRFGLCPPEALCVDGACAALCSPARADGVCVEDAVCVQGECRSRCSAANPEGACAEGRCVRGECVTDCAGIAWPDDACFACAWDAIEIFGCDPGPDRCRACIDCPGEPQGEPGSYRYPSTCDCLERASCDGCREEATAFWGCVLARCPVCAE